MNTRKLKVPKVRRVTLEVYCHSDDVKLVKDSMKAFFAEHEVELWRPRGPQVDAGVEPSKTRAARWASRLAEEALWRQLDRALTKGGGAR